MGGGDERSRCWARGMTMTGRGEDQEGVDDEIAEHQRGGGAGAGCRGIRKRGWRGKGVHLFLVGRRG